MRFTKTKWEEVRCERRCEGEARKARGITQRRVQSKGDEKSARDRAEPDADKDKKVPKSSDIEKKRSGFEADSG